MRERGEGKGERERGDEYERVSVGIWVLFIKHNSCMESFIYILLSRYCLIFNKKNLQTPILTKSIYTIFSL